MATRDAPKVVLRAALLLALFGVADETELSRNATADAAIHRLLRLPRGDAPLDPAELARGLVRLADNAQARAAVRSIVAALRDEAETERLVENDSVIALWTAGPAATAAVGSCGGCERRPPTSEKRTTSQARPEIDDGGR